MSVSVFRIKFKVFPSVLHDRDFTYIFLSTLTFRRDKVEVGFTQDSDGAAFFPEPFADEICPMLLSCASDNFPFRVEEAIMEEVYVEDCS